MCGSATPPPLCWSSKDVKNYRSHNFYLHKCSCCFAVINYDGRDIGGFARYFLNDALTWSEEVARFSMIWLSFLGGGLVFRHGGHVAIDLLVRRLSGGALRTAIFGLSQFVIVAFLAVLFWYGIEMVQQANYMTTPALQISMMIPYAAIPIGAVLMMYHLVIVSLKKRGDGHADERLASE